jgi:hypothetical protein
MAKAIVFDYSISHQLKLGAIELYVVYTICFLAQ